MSKQDKKRIVIGIASASVLSFIIIFFSIKGGIAKGNLLYRFAERQTMTFLSSLWLGLTASVSLSIYLLKRKHNPHAELYAWWLISAIGFFFLSMDEYFMAHEGLDDWVASWFGITISSGRFDNLVLVGYGIIAMGICYYFRKAIFRHKIIVPFLYIGIFCLGGSVVFHALSPMGVVYEVVEESFEFVGMTALLCGYILTFLSYLDELVVSSASQ